MTYLVVAYLDALVLVGLCAAALGGDRQIRRGGRIAVLLAAGAGLLVAHAVLVWRLTVQGWVFAENTVLLGLPLVGVPLLAVAVLAVRPSGHAADVDAPWVSVALQALAVGAALAALIVAVPPVPPLGGDAAALWAVLVVASVLLAWRAVSPTGRTVATAAGPAAALLLVAGAGWGAVTSGVPERVAHGDHGNHGVATADLREDDRSGPVRQYTLTAAPTTVTLPSGRALDAWTFNGTAPGPQLDVTQGDLVEVTLVNAGITDGVTLHWHGVNVPNAEDGVAGVTQDAVGLGERHTYRFRAEDVGSFWYHSHQVSSQQVRRGLFGALVVRPRGNAGGTDVTLLAHAWPDGPTTLGGSDGETVYRAAVGTVVRARLVNTDSSTATFGVAGAPFRVVAIDGHDVAGPTPLSGTTLRVGGGGRYDVEFRQPAGAVRVGRPGAATSAVFAPDATAAAPAVTGGPVLDPTTYGSPGPLPFDPRVADRSYTMLLDQRPGFAGHRPTRVWTVNGKRFPDVPPFVVTEGDLVRMTIVNRGPSDHPMHLHGHHVAVLSRDGRPASGSPLSLDTVLVAPGEVWEIAFRADNPGIWMDHCHDLHHAATGMVAHLAYEGVHSPFEIGTASGNLPE